MTNLGIIIGLLCTFSLSAQSISLSPAARVEQIKNYFAPDKRTAVFEVKAAIKNKQWLLRGETNLPQAKDSLLRVLKTAQIKFIDSIRVLPETSLASIPFGVVTVSPANLRSNPGHAQELATQALVGTPLKLWKRQENWYLVQTPDDYLGWLEEGAFQPLSTEGFLLWQQKPKVVFTGLAGSVLVGADPKSRFVGDANAGDIFVFRGDRSNLAEVEYADGRVGYIYKVQLVPWYNWLETRQPSVENILSTAHDLLGRPYLWGGTAPKGMDCSGFTKTVFFLNGIILSRDASQQVRTGRLVTTTLDWQLIKPGDFLFFGQSATGKTPEKVTHVALHLGNGKIIHSGDGRVQIQSLVPGDPDFAQKRFSTFLKAKRMLPFQPDREIKWVQDVYR